MKRNFAIVFTCALFAVLSCFGVSAATSENATNEMTIEQLTNLIFSKCFWNRKFLLMISAWKKSLVLKGATISSTYSSTPLVCFLYIYMIE